MIAAKFKAATFRKAALQIGFFEEGIEGRG